MAYTGTQAITGRGAVIAINTGTSGSPTWTQVFEITDGGFDGQQAATLDATNLQSQQKEFISGLPDPGTLTSTGNYVSGDPGQVAVGTAYAAAGTNAAMKQWKVTMPLQSAQATTGDTYTFSGIVQEWVPVKGLKADAIVTFSLKVKISGTITKVVGS